MTLDKFDVYSNQAIRRQYLSSVYFLLHFISVDDASFCRLLWQGGL